MESEKPITITPEAQEHFAGIVQEANALGVRLRLQGGGCAGFSYQWDLITDLTD